MLRRLAALALAAAVATNGAAAFASEAHANPTGACLWAGLTGPERDAFTDTLSRHAGLTAELRSTARRSIRRCGFEANDTGLARGGFLLAMMVYRTRIESLIEGQAHIAPATLDRAYVQLNPAFHRQLIIGAGERFDNHTPPPVDEAAFSTLLNRLNIDPLDNREAMENYLVVRATIDYVETVGPAFRLPAPPEPPPATPAHP
jgi:hypothetical protein